MKKLEILLFIGVIAVLASCTKYEAKTVQLANMNDSLNYTLGLANGASIKSYYLREDSTEKVIAEFMKALDEAYTKDEDATDSEMFEMGKNIGSYFKQQEADGLLGDTTLVFNKKIALQALINALNKYEKGMTADDARNYFRATIEARRNSQPEIMDESLPAEEPVQE